MKLTAEKVKETLLDCLFETKPEDPSIAVVAEGIISSFGFDPVKIAKNRETIKELLAELPDNFRTEIGGGQSFLVACGDKNGDVWGEHPDVEALLVLGIAAGYGRWCMPRHMWEILPGGMPYYQFSLEAANDPS